MNAGEEAGSFDYSTLLRLAGEMGWKPWEFWRSTPREFFLCLRGRDEARRWELRLAAWQSSVLLHAWVKDAPSPAKLLGEEAEPIAFMDADSMRLALRARAKRAAEKAVEAERAAWEREESRRKRGGRK